MKRYLTGILAVIIAISAVAFTRPAKNLDMVTFIYNPPTTGDYSQPSVQNKANWSAGTASCSGDLSKACSLQVPDNETTSGGTQLASGVTITATKDPHSANYYVSGGTFVSNIVNKE